MPKKHIIKIKDIPVQNAQIGFELWRKYMKYLLKDMSTELVFDFKDVDTYNLRFLFESIGTFQHSFPNMNKQLQVINAKPEIAEKIAWVRKRCTPIHVKEYENIMKMKNAKEPHIYGYGEIWLLPNSPTNGSKARVGYDKDNKIKGAIVKFYDVKDNVETYREYKVFNNKYKAWDYLEDLNYKPFLLFPGSVTED